MLDALDVLDRLVTGLKSVREIARRMHDAELLSAIAELSLDSAQLKSEMADIRQDNTRLRGKLDELRQRAECRSKISIENGMYYLKEAIKGYSEGPFCTRCFDSEGKLITMMGPGWQPGISYGIGTFRAQDGRGWTCPECIRTRSYVGRVNRPDND